MIDHTGLTVSDYARSRDFYQRVLAPLGYAVVMEVTEKETGPGGYQGCCFGPPGKPAFWVGNGAHVSTGTHVAFEAPNRAAVDAFYAQALAAGATDNGPPGIRAHYHPNYYGAFVRDADGNNIEAVCHAPA